MKHLIITLSLFIGCFTLQAQKIKIGEDGNYYAVEKEKSPVLVKMNTDDRGLISCVGINGKGEEFAMDYMKFEEFNKLFNLTYSGRLFITEGSKYHIYLTKTEKMFVFRTSKSTGKVYKQNINL